MPIRPAITPRLLILAFILGLAGCNGADAINPIGIGSDRDQLKRSPCACFEILQDFRGWMHS